MNHLDGPRKARNDTKTAHVFAQLRAFRGLSALSIAGAIAIGSFFAFSLVGESDAVHHKPAAGETVAHTSQATITPAKTQAPIPSLHPKNAETRIEPGLTRVQTSPVAQAAERVQKSIVFQNSSAAPAVSEASQIDTAPRNRSAPDFRSPLPLFATGPRASGPISTAQRAGVIAEEKPEPKPVTKTPAATPSPEISSPEPRTAAESKPAQPRSKTQPPQPIVSAAQPTLGRKPREWPKPFTPEEERIRQQMGVQAFINYQHQLATGEKREAE